MNTRIIALALCALAFSAGARTVQKGFVQEYKEKAAKSPLPGVEINIRSAGSTVSAKDGAFTLEFLTLNPGEKVNVRAIEKTGYEIFNKEAIEQWNINPDTPFTIVMCRSDRFKRIRDAYHKVSSASYARQLKKEQDALNKLKEEGRLKDEEYTLRLANLQEEYETRLDKLETYIDRFSRIDMTELSAAEQQIIDMVQAGNIDEAIKRYEEIDFIGNYRREMEAVQKLLDAQQAINQARQNKRENASKLRESVMRQIGTLRLAGGYENMRRAGELLKSLADADSTDAASALEFASYAFDHNDFDIARTYLIRAERYGKDDTKYAAQVGLQGIEYLTGVPSENKKHALRDLLDNEFTKQNRELRCALLIMALTNPGDNGISDEDAAKIFEEVYAYRPRSFIDHYIRMLAMTVETEYKNKKGLFASPTERKHEILTHIEYGFDVRSKYPVSVGFDNILLSEVVIYLSIALPEKDFVGFDRFCPDGFEIASGMFASDPTRFVGNFQSLNMLRIVRLMMQPTETPLADTLRSYFAQYRPLRTTEPGILQSLGSECVTYIGFAPSFNIDPTVITDTLFEMLPLDAQAPPEWHNMAAGLIYTLSNAGTDINKYKELINQSLKIYPDSAPMNQIKAIVQ
ncbi:MAG: hypothetical protein K2L96_04140 [Muribaculaceae bacterium]|nr:hypothetical protein [Muribaculaceae bacterium]